MKTQIGGTRPGVFVSRARDDASLAITPQLLALFNFMLLTTKRKAANFLASAVAMRRAATIQIELCS